MLGNEKVHVICLNDSVEFVFVGEESNAKEKLEDLARNYHVVNSLCYNFKTYAEYRKSHYYWHIHTVESNIRGGIGKNIFLL